MTTSDAIGGSHAKVKLVDAVELVPVFARTTFNGCFLSMSKAAWAA
jgi:hypothetical protein